MSQTLTTELDELEETAPVIDEADLEMLKPHTPEAELHPDTIVSVVEAGLHYAADFMPGITREKTKDGFRYRQPDGSLLTDEAEIKRINRLAIPPAYTDVWICPDPLGFLQATGRDARGRKQYRYHTRWRIVRDETKYTRMMAFAEALPRIRARVDHDLAAHGMPREKVLATIVRLLETTRIRVGNEEYAKENHSFGLTTLQNEHVDVTGSTVHFHFRGKSGKEHAIDLKDKRLARIVKQCQELPGQELFKYVDDSGDLQTVESADVNAYLREISGEDFTAKDFRTWAGTVLAALALQEYEACDSQAQMKKNVVRAIESVAKRLGNTPSVCRKCYVHPGIIESYTDGTMLQVLERFTHEELSENLRALQPEEAAVVALLESRLHRETDHEVTSGK